MKKKKCRRVLIIYLYEIFIFAFYKLGIKFIGKALLGTVTLSIFIDMFDKFQPITTDRFLASIYGGIVVGLGTSIIFNVGASTGGTDLITIITKAYKPTIKMGEVLTVIDVCIVALNTIFFREIEIGLYSAIAIFILGRVLDIIFEGINFTKLIIIISDRNEEISAKIHELERGVTGLYGKGMYTEEEKLVLICATPRGEVGKIRTIAEEIDKNCFIIISKFINLSYTLKQLPPTNSLIIELLGRSSLLIPRKYSRNLSSLLASSYSGTSFGIPNNADSANCFNTASS